MSAQTAFAPKTPTEQKVTRVTRSGRKLTYRLRVIQQPERARACGSGAKSSADRRPVDPPPVVELRIFEGESCKDDQDITFAYAANFFLFATLEVARPMAHARGQQPAASPVVPVLTGMPVSGMAYLDRPNEAGYFIFPDLSVRHEGKYRLSFNLYEETKNPKEDGDLEPAQGDNKGLAGPANPDVSFDWRLEAKSAPFLVYSAKKFPGLAESTSLSRTVAEQGCRVRIRRDVRMRRREGKAAGDYDDVQEDEYRGRVPEPEPYQQRSRSNSAGSDEGRGPPYPDAQRRDSYYSPSPVGGQPAPHRGNLNFNDGFNGQQYPAPPVFAQPQPPQQSWSQTTNGFQPPAPPSYRQAPPQPQPTHNFDRQYPQTVHPSYPPREHREYEQDHRRASVPTSYGPPPPPPPPPPQQPQPQSFLEVDSGYHGRAQFSNGYPRGPSPTPQLAPLKLLEASKYEGVNSPTGPLSSISRIAPALHSPTYERSQDRLTLSQLAAAPIPAQLEPIRSGSKRAFEHAFNASSTAQPLFNGMRPSSSHANQPDADEEEENEAEMKKNMTYKRANGALTTRPEVIS